ncbi:Predicted ATP-dependent carboligase, ATP-grasp superfamily [Corynebacterium pollutisoli]|uniref:Predicted ATP-dependent carboligase, ATP-grasp superfamily n=1 Tax=Corynebacterium pollutisoli TaxID=1610489 RepID=A0A1X7IBS6_9CORY|nr:PAC2 family protein [Corynebacterium pollutisoli]SMG12103.1 Predicted ATP-dependent carboligase, ATP-grasp superfamily [Corynebacterium pollutisoli]
MQDNERRMYELEYPAPEVGAGTPEGPTLIVALQGYADAGHAVESSADHLLAALDSRPVASFNNDELIDYRSRRPAVTMDNHQITGMENLDLGIRVLRDTEGRSFLLLSGPEPDLRWEAFTEAVADLVEKFGVQKTICLYAAPMAVPHTRPLVVSAHSNTPQLVNSMFTYDSKVILPGSASMMIERALHKRDLHVAGFTAHVPHYLAASPYPAATHELLDAVARAAELSLPLRALEHDMTRVTQQLSEQVDDSHEIQQVVAHLERQYDEELERYRASNPKAMLPGEHEMPSGDEIGEEFERFLAALDATEEDNRTEEVGGPAELPEADPGDEFPDDE